MSKWTEECIKEFADSFAGGTPSRSRSDYYHNGTIPWISSSEVNQPYIVDTFEKITQIGFENSSAKWIPKNSVLVAMYGATAGQVSKNLIDATSNQAVLALVPKKNKIDGNFLYYQVKQNKDSILFLAQGSGQPNLSKDLIDNYKIKAPTDINEQLKISKILFTADAVIDKTEAAITKYKAIKQGMLHDLYTRGIDIKTGKLRPLYSEAPELYKESPLGWLPRVWDVERLGDIGMFKNGVNKGKTSFGYGTLFVNIIDAYPEILNFKTLGRVFINETEKHDYGLVKGDLIFVRSSVKPSGVGYNTLFVQYSEDVVFCGFMIRFRLNDKEKYSPEFYNSYFRFDEFRRRLITSSTVSANTNINQGALSNLLAIKPDENEQAEIILRLKTIDNKHQAEQKYLHKLQQLKSGLMGDLLSGKKEVIIKEEVQNG